MRSRCATSWPSAHPLRKLRRSWSSSVSSRPGKKTVTGTKPCSAELAKKRSRRASLSLYRFLRLDQYLLSHAWTGRVRSKKSGYSCGTETSTPSFSSNFGYSKPTPGVVGEQSAKVVRVEAQDYYIRSCLLHEALERSHHQVESVSRHAHVVDAPARFHRFDDFGQALLGVHAISEDEGIPQEKDPRAFVDSVELARVPEAATVGDEWDRIGPVRRVPVRGVEPRPESIADSGVRLIQDPDVATGRAASGEGTSRGCGALPPPRRAGVVRCPPKARGGQRSSSSLTSKAARP